MQLITASTGFILFVFGGIACAAAAECNTSSGSLCKVSCSTGTASAVCSSNSKTCSTSCSDSSGNMDEILARSMEEVLGQSVPIYYVQDCLRGAPSGRVECYAGGYNFVISIDPPQ
jgi:hypothetical protein